MICSRSDGILCGGSGARRRHRAIGQERHEDGRALAFHRDNVAEGDCEDQGDRRLVATSKFECARRQGALVE